MADIDISDMTKDYGESRGVFDANLEVKKGEVYGFIGINRAGKTTTIRNLMGFIKPTSDKASIIKSGKIIDTVDINNLKNGNLKTFKIEFANNDEFKKFTNEYKKIKSSKENECNVDVSINEVGNFLNNLKNYKVKSLKEHHLTLEEYFKKVYKEEK